MQPVYRFIESSAIYIFPFSKQITIEYCIYTLTQQFVNATNLAKAFVTVVAWLVNLYIFHITGECECQVEQIAVCCDGVDFKSQCEADCK